MLYEQVLKIRQRKKTLQREFIEASIKLMFFAVEDIKIEFTNPREGIVSNGEKAISFRVDGEKIFLDGKMIKPGESHPGFSLL
ncbi:MAG: hypothetical protein D6784_08905 [Chloroflexi bacterium]|nr:MAG: hypothetical protein D6784_08905 [Chloroflexota bacterium]